MRRKHEFGVFQQCNGDILPFRLDPVEIDLTEVEPDGIRRIENSFGGRIDATMVSMKDGTRYALEVHAEELAAMKIADDLARAEEAETTEEASPRGP